MLSVDLFAWWAISISWGIVFLIIISVYLYSGSRKKRSEGVRTHGDKGSFVRDFIFVWVLIGLLFFYVISVNVGSSALFAAGNIAVEILLVVYLLKNKSDSLGSSHPTVESESATDEKLKNEK
jgi:hypothetical protein